ncbi:signal peptidase II [Patescibacteria group bacterium]|nr:signal peptidase II [Patescibacteria group bacterium]
MSKTSFWINTTKIAISVYIIDQVLKWQLQGINYELMPGVSLIYGENFGIAFGLPVPVWGSILMTLVLLVIGAVAVSKYFDLSKRLNSILVGLVVGGALGNLFDRLIHGFVIDYISIWKWPIFNFADACIVAAAGIILLKSEKLLKQKLK